MPGHILVQKAPKAPFLTIQDLGRYGYQQSGIPVTGALDRYAFRAANRLAGNPLSAACLEITLMGVELMFPQDTILALAGADATAKVNGCPIRLWMSHYVPAGSVLSIGKAVKGVRVYLAVAGGIDVPPVMGSRSTDLRNGIGGFHGRGIQTGDILPIGKHSGTYVPRRMRKLPSYLSAPGEETWVRIVLGPQDDFFTKESIRRFLTSSYQITPYANRMGYRLNGSALFHVEKADMISDAIPEGAIQVPANGQPIILLADRQTTGGYPKIGTVISADLPKLAQLAPGASIRFEAVTVEQAQKILRQTELGWGFKQ